MWFLPITAIFLFIGYRFLARRTISRHGRRLRSAPDRLPLLGHALKFIRPRHELFDWFVHCQRQHGLETLEIAVPTLPPGVIITDPVNLEFVLKNEQLVSKGNFVKSRSWDLFGNGIINASGDLWKAQRKAGLKFFSGTNLEALVDEILPEAYSRIEPRLLKHAKDGTVVDMQSVFLDFTSFVMGHMAYDMDLDSSHPFSKAFDYASDQIGRRFQNPLYQVTEFFFGSKLNEALAEVRAFGDKIVTRAKGARSKAAFQSLITVEEPVFDTLIDSLMEAFPDPSIVADSALNFLSAGKDTTAQSLTWTLYAILRHPEVLKPLREEIESLSVAKGSGDVAQKWTMADLQPSNVPYLMATYYEALRLYPPVPFEIQECQQNLTLPDGTFLPNGSLVVWCIWAINRAKEMHGDDADDFQPTRWLDSAGRFLNRSAFEFPVFNGGPRACLGKKMAETMAMFLMVALFQDFNFNEPVSEHGPVAAKRAQNSLTLPMEDGLSCHIMRSDRKRHRDPFPSP